MSEAKAKAFTAAERRALLDEFFAVGERIDAVPSGVEPEPKDLARYAELRRTYRERLPVLALSRCPFTKTPYEHSIDPFGIDGLWWDHRSPNRPLELLQGTVLAFTGALDVKTPIERMPLLCRPGPGAPFVVPRLLAREGVRAVISSLPIGRHSGYVIVYFADPVPDDLERFNDWGTDFYQFESDTDRMGWNQGSAGAADHDFDLEKYLTSGQLMWIAPGDASLELRSGAGNCPYTGLKGSRLQQLVQDGERWYEDLQDYDSQPAAEAATEAEPAAEPAAAPEPPRSSPPAPARASTPPAKAAAPKAAPPPALAPAAAASAPTATPAGAPSALVCASCGAAIKRTTKFCPGCGKPASALPPAAAPAASSADVCAHCGQPRRAGARFCRSCGKA